jgi:hypothetical protein
LDWTNRVQMIIAMKFKVEDHFHNFAELRRRDGIL